MFNLCMDHKIRPLLCVVLLCAIYGPLRHVNCDCCAYIFLSYFALCSCAAALLFGSLAVHVVI